jgi:hypothetical protein
MKLLCTRLCLALSMLSFLGACAPGPNQDERNEEATDQPFGGGGGGVSQNNTPRAPLPNVPEIIRGRWEVNLSTDDDSESVETLALVEDANELETNRSSDSQPISGTLPVAVSFKVSNSEFAPPTIINGLTSWGSLKVTELSDNSMRSCGENRRSRCTAAFIRIYTAGTAGPGLWSDDEGYGLPILTGSSTVGLGASNAAIVGRRTIEPSLRRLSLSHFTSERSLMIPINVDFSDAGAGTYRSTLTVEYVIQ